MPAERKSPDPRRPAWGEAKTNLAQLGAIVGERYRLEAMLGRGGMGIVFAAVHLHTQRPVAVKLIHCPWDEAALALYRRFLGEARTASAVRHRNVVDVLDMGYHNGAPYLVMERLSGDSLEQRLERVQQLPLETVLEWLLPVMGALGVLHATGIVHRDIKPSNIFLARDPTQAIVPKLLDFGLAQAAWEAPLTEPGVMLGTPEYMSPERARGQSVGPGADIWAMGVVLFECLCGRVPFTATTLNGIAAQIVAGEVLKTHEANPRVPAAVAAVIDRALALAPADRHRDMGSFAYDLAYAAHQSGATLPEDPDPVGLPSFRVLARQREAWASGPLAVPAESGVQLSPTRPAPVPAQRWLGRVALPALCVLMLAAGAASWRLVRESETRVHPPRVAPPPVASAHSTRFQTAPPAPEVVALPAPAASVSTPSPTASPPTLHAQSVKPHAEPAPQPRRTRTKGDRDPASAATRPTEPAPPIKPATPSQNEFEKEWL